MGEYARRNSDKAEIKIGTCENMYYLRYEDRNKVSKLPGSLNPATTFDLRFRLPLPDEDRVKIGEYDSCFVGVPLPDYKNDFSAQDPGTMQVHHQPSGLLINLPCYHGEKLPEVGPYSRAFWNGKEHSYELIAVKNTREGLFPIIQCRHCQKMWRENWGDVLAHITCETLKKRLAAYEGKALAA